MKQQNEPSIQRTLTDNFEKMSRLSLETMKPLMDNMFETASGINNSILKGELLTINLSSFINNKHSNCCPPKQECPPHCIATIHRQAVSNERIIVPFSIKNTCSTIKTYRVGVRELTDNNGSTAPSQPVLNKTSVTLQPGRSERVLMGLDLANYNAGNTYTTEVVIREKDINQNICFSLYITNATITEVSPYDESKYKQKWLNWQSHFYCEPRKKSDSTTPGTAQNKS
ncbi:hypothetical protein [Lacinutrix chionoecetis]